MRKVIITMIVLIIALSTIVFAASFSDISGHWAETYIITLANENVISGYPDGTYKPNNTLTYGEYFKLIVTASLPGTDFSQLDNPTGHWAGPYLTVLENYDIVEKGTITKETLNAKISRVEVVRVLSECDIKIRGNAQRSATLDFTDIDNITSMEKTLLKHAVATGVISGDPEGTFRPNGELRRSEVAKIIATYTGK